MGDAVWLRNQVVAPVTEELVFRGAMLPMLVPCTGPTAAIFTAPLFFGVGMATRCQGFEQLSFTTTFLQLALAHYHNRLTIKYIIRLNAFCTLE